MQVELDFTRWQLTIEFEQFRNNDLKPFHQLFSSIGFNGKARYVVTGGNPYLGFIIPYCIDCELPHA